jgi:hypothetical protein
MIVGEHHANRLAANRYAATRVRLRRETAGKRRESLAFRNDRFGRGRHFAGAVTR